MNLRIEERAGEVALVDPGGRTICAVPVVMSRDGKAMAESDPRRNTDAQALELARWIFDGLQVAEHVATAHRACGVGCDWAERVAARRGPMPGQK